jgi:hypothetical protein
VREGWPRGGSMLGTTFLGQVVQLGLGHMFMKGTGMAHTTFLIHAIL